MLDRCLTLESRGMRLAQSSSFFSARENIWKKKHTQSADLCWGIAGPPHNTISPKYFNVLCNLRLDFWFSDHANLAIEIMLILMITSFKYILEKLHLHNCFFWCSYYRCIKSVDIRNRIWSFFSYYFWLPNHFNAITVLPLRLFVFWHTTQLNSMRFGAQHDTAEFHALCKWVCTHAA